MKGVNVFYHGHPSGKIKVGHLGYKEGRIAFEYHDGFIEKGLELSPILLPCRKGVQKQDGSSPWKGLPGVFNDSLPDGWGLLLMDRHLKSMGIDPSTINPLDRLAYMGDRTMGALSYEPSTVPDTPTFDINLSSIAEASRKIYRGETSKKLAEICKAGGSPGGARPKVIVHLKDEHLISGEQDVPPGYESWVIKFFSEDESGDTGRNEYAYSLMARDAGIIMPDTRLFDDNEGNAWFGIKRFDRADGGRVHMHTLGGLVDADFRLPSLDYEDILRFTRNFTKNQGDVEQMFRVMVFNVLANNRDDHSKNFSFLMDHHGRWRCSPAYDLTESTGINGEHSTTVAGEGSKPTKAHMFSAGEAGGLNKEIMNNLFDRVYGSVVEWDRWQGLAGISEAGELEVSL